MKKIMPFLMVLAVLAAGIVYYVYETQKVPVEASAPQEEVVMVNLTKPVQINHPAWQDTIVPDKGNRVYRKSNHDGAQISEITDNSFVLTWDGWGIEVFQKNPQTGVYTLKEKRKKN